MFWSLQLRGEDKRSTTGNRTITRTLVDALLFFSFRLHHLCSTLDDGHYGEHFLSLAIFKAVVGDIPTSSIKIDTRDVGTVLGGVSNFGFGTFGDVSDDVELVQLPLHTLGSVLLDSS